MDDERPSLSSRFRARCRHSSATKCPFETAVLVGATGREIGATTVRSPRSSTQGGLLGGPSAGLTLSGYEQQPRCVLLRGRGRSSGGLPLRRVLGTARNDDGAA